MHEVYRRSIHRRDTCTQDDLKQYDYPASASGGRLLGLIFVCFSMKARGLAASGRARTLLPQSIHYVKSIQIKLSQVMVALVDIVVVIVIVFVFPVAVVLNDGSVSW